MQKLILCPPKISELEKFFKLKQKYNNIIFKFSATSCIRDYTTYLLSNTKIITFGWKLTTHWGLPFNIQLMEDEPNMADGGSVALQIM